MVADGKAQRAGLLVTSGLCLVRRRVLTEHRVFGVRSHHMLSLVAAVSGIYDLLLGGLLLGGRDTLAQLTGSPLPPIHADLNGLFLLVIGAGYVLPWRDPVRYRAYLWIMGPLLKGAGAAVFVADHVFRGSPAVLLAFAATDGTLALVTLAVLVGVRPSSGHAGAQPGRSESPPA